MKKFVLMMLISASSFASVEGFKYFSGDSKKAKSLKETAKTMKNMCKPTFLISSSKASKKDLIKIQMDEIAKFAPMISRDFALVSLSSVIGGDSTLTNKMVENKKTKDLLGKRDFRFTIMSYTGKILFSSDTNVTKSEITKALVNNWKCIK